MTYLDRARRLIPSGTQTYSKSPTRFPAGAPEYITHGEGAYVYCGMDPTPWLDCVSGLGSVILGHRDPSVEAAILAQLASGVAMPMPTPLELELAERIVAYVHSAEMVRFGKNGVDACAAAVRIARAHTGREMVASIGYHGYHDFTIAHQNPKGVPLDSLDNLIVLPYGDMERMERVFGAFADVPACLIMEPVVAQHPEHPPAGYLEAVRDLCTKYGVILIFDEVVTFGRMPGGTAQKYFGVTPDLTALGKCLGNGMPLSAVCGRADLMRLLDEGVFFSTTFGGETLSLAAGIATMDRLMQDRVPEQVTAIGAVILQHFHRYAEGAGFGDGVVKLMGYPARLVWKWSDPEDARVFGETLVQHHVLSQGYVSVTRAWGSQQVLELSKAFAAGMDAVRQRRKAAA